MSPLFTANKHRFNRIPDSTERLHQLHRLIVNSCEHLVRNMFHNPPTQPQISMLMRDAMDTTGCGPATAPATQPFTADLIENLHTTHPEDRARCVGVIRRIEGPNITRKQLNDLTPVNVTAAMYARGKQDLTMYGPFHKPDPPPRAHRLNPEQMDGALEFLSQLILSCEINHYRTQLIKLTKNRELTTAE